MSATVLTREQAFRARPADALLAWVELSGVTPFNVPYTFKWAALPISTAATALEPRLLRISQAGTKLSDLDGALEGATCTIEIVDTDNEARSWLANTFQKRLLNRQAVVYVQTVTDFDAGNDPIKVFQGRVKDYKPVAGGTFRFELQGWLDSLIEQQLTLPRIAAAFPNTTDASKTRLGRLIYGRLSDERSATAGPEAADEAESGATSGEPGIVGMGHLRDADGDVLTGPTGLVVTEELSGGNFLAADDGYVMVRMRKNGLWTDATPFLHFDTGEPITIASNGSGVRATCDVDPDADLYRFFFGVEAFGSVRWDQYLDTVDPTVGVLFTDAPGAGGQAIDNLPQVLTAGAGHHEFEAIHEYAMDAELVDGWTPTGVSFVGFWSSMQQPFRAPVRIVATPVTGAIRYRVKRRPPGGEFDTLWYVPATSVNDDGNIVFEDDLQGTNAIAITESLEPKGVMPCIPVGAMTRLDGIEVQAFAVAAHACKAIVNLYIDARTLVTAASKASAEIGELTDTPAKNSRITIEADTVGPDGNALTVRVQAGVGVDVPLSAQLIDNVLTVILATDGSGAPNDAANTADLVAAAIDAVTGVSATTSGTDVVPPGDDVKFDGGADAVYDEATRTIQLVEDARYGADFFAPGKPDFGDFFPAVYYDAPNGTRWCLVYALGSDAALLADETNVLWANVEGVEDAGDGSGDLLEELVDQIAHLFDNFILPDTSYAGGLWAAAAPTWANGDAKREAASWAAAQTAREAVFDDTTGAFAIVEDTAYVDLVASLMESADCDYSDAAGAVALVLRSPDPTITAPVAHVTEGLDIAAGSFDVQPLTDLAYFWNRRSFSHTPAYALDGGVTYTGTGRVDSAVSQAAYGVRENTTPVEFVAIRGGAAADVMARKLARAEDGEIAVTWATGMSGLMRSLGDVISIEHSEGIGREGYTARALKIIGRMALLEEGRVVMECREAPPSEVVIEVEDITLEYSALDQDVTLHADVTSGATPLEEGEIAFEVVNDAEAELAPGGDDEIESGVAELPFTVPGGTGA